MSQNSSAPQRVEARQRDRGRGSRSTRHRCAWIDRWVLTQSEGGLTGSRAGQKELRTRLLTRQRDQERRAALQDAEGKAMRLVLSEELDAKLRALQAPLRAENKQAVVERLVELAYAQQLGNAAPAALSLRPSLRRANPRGRQATRVPRPIA